MQSDTLIWPNCTFDSATRVFHVPSDSDGSSFFILYISNSSTKTFTLPPGVVEGILCLLFYWYTSSTGTFTAPTGGDITSLFIVYRYNSTTGAFTVSPGGDGYFYFSLNLRVKSGIGADFDIRINNDLLCSAFTDLSESPSNDSVILQWYCVCQSRYLQ